jgi:hypothetical protein
VRNSTSIHPLYCPASALRIVQLKGYGGSKLPTNVLASDFQIPMQKQKKYEKGKMTHPKLNNSRVTNNNESEVDEISGKKTFLK